MLYSSQKTIFCLSLSFKRLSPPSPPPHSGPPLKICPTFMSTPSWKLAPTFRPTTMPLTYIGLYKISSNLSSDPVSFWQSIHSCHCHNTPATTQYWRRFGIPYCVSNNAHLIEDINETTVDKVGFNYFGYIGHFLYIFDKTGWTHWKLRRVFYDILAGDRTQKRKSQLSCFWIWVNT